MLASFPGLSAKMCQHLQDQKWLQWAWQLQQSQNELFWDEEGGGGYFSSTAHDASILLRVKDGQRVCGTVLCALLWFDWDIVVRLMVSRILDYSPSSLPPSLF